jgi:hypothetical protein
MRPSGANATAVGSATDATTESVKFGGSTAAAAAADGLHRGWAPPQAAATSSFALARGTGSMVCSARAVPSVSVSTRSPAGGSGWVIRLPTTSETLPCREGAPDTKDAWKVRTRKSPPMRTGRTPRIVIFASGPPEPPARTIDPQSQACACAHRPVNGHVEIQSGTRRRRLTPRTGPAVVASPANHGLTRAPRGLMVRSFSRGRRGGPVR